MRKKLTGTTKFYDLSVADQHAICSAANAWGQMVPEQAGTGLHINNGRLAGSDFMIAVMRRVDDGERDYGLKNFALIDRSALKDFADTLAAMRSHMLKREAITAFYSVIIAAESECNRPYNWFSAVEAYNVFCTIYKKAGKRARKLGIAFKIGRPMPFDSFTRMLNCFACRCLIVNDGNGGYYIMPSAMTLCSLNTLKQNMPEELTRATLLNTVQKTYSDGTRKFGLTGNVLKFVTNSSVLWADAVAFCMQPMVGVAYFQILSRIRLCDNQFSISITYLAHKLGVTVRQVRRILHRLEDLGIVAFGTAPSKKQPERPRTKTYSAGCVGIVHAMCGRLTEEKLRKVLAVFGASSITDKIIDVFGWFRRREARRALSDSPMKRLIRKAEAIKRSLTPTESFDTALA